MANPDARFGLRPVRHIDGTPWNGGTVRCYIAAAYTDYALFIGDPVDIDNELDDRVAGVMVPTVERSAFVASKSVLGVITSFEPDGDDLSLTYRKNSTARYCNVCCDPTVIFQIRDDGGTIPGVVTIGQNACGIYTHAGSTATGLSGLELDFSTAAVPAADVTYPMIIVGAADDGGNSFDGSADTRVIWEVMITSWRLLGPYQAYGARGVTAA